MIAQRFSPTRLLYEGEIEPRWEQDLNKQIYELLRKMDFQADLECCLIEANMAENRTSLMLKVSLIQMHWQISLDFT